MNCSGKGLALPVKGLCDVTVGLSGALTIQCLLRVRGVYLWPGLQSCPPAQILANSLQASF